MTFASSPTANQDDFNTMATKASIQSLGSVSLNGAWECKQAGTEHWFAATVPGCNFTDLVAAGRIEDPFYRDNEGQLQWIEKEDWIYRKTFEIDGDHVVGGIY